MKESATTNAGCKDSLVQLVEKSTHGLRQENPTKRESSVQLASFNKLVWISSFLYSKFFLPFLQNKVP